MLVKEAARRAGEENMFDEVVMVTVSAMRLQQWLKKQDKRVLLILDDIWDGQRLELEQVGIAIEGDQSIASEEDLGRPLMQKDENRIEELLKEGKLNSCTAISLPYSSNNKLPDNLECPRLKLLVLFNKNPSLEVPDNFFKRMSELLILDFTGMDFASLPSSFTSLRNLQRLRFDECKLNDIAIVGKLKQLDTLKILSSDIQRLPQEI
ncbi:hypothetical protein Gotur_031633, partial [Gossypium turneri]